MVQELHLKYPLIFLLAFGSAACTKSGNENYEALATRKLTCPEGSASEYSGWGPNGMQDVCKLKHGPFNAAEGGRIVLEGEYKMGKPSGTWKWYDKSGKVEKMETY